MSILLESLSQQSDESSAHLSDKVPTMHEAHFDDDMLGDEWLVQRIKQWQAFALLLVLLLLGSWYYFYWSLNINQPKSETPAQLSTLTNQDKASVPINTDAMPQSSPIKEIDVAIVSEPEITPIQATNLIAESTASKLQISQEVYQPKKRPLSSPPINSELASEKSSAVAQTKAVASSLNAPISRSELPLHLQKDFPDISVDSYVVADTQKESFIILDGAFYQINQVISANLTLRDITQQHIVVEFHAHWVEIPLN